MTNPKTAKKAVIFSAIALVLSAAMLIGATFAWFTDSVTTPRNRIEAGNLDVELYHSSAATKNEFKPVESNTALFLNVNGDPILWEPGAESVETFKIVNEGTVALKYQFTITGYDYNTFGELSLADALTVSIGSTSGSLKTYVYTGWLKAGESIAYTANVSWIPGENDNAWNLKDEANLGNGKYATSDGEPLWIDLGINLVATQQTYEEDYQDNQYDDGAYYVTEVSNEDELVFALALGGNIELSNSIELSETVTVPAGVTATLNLNGKTLTGSILAPNADLTVENGTIANTEATVSAIEINSGKLTLNNVTIESARHAVRVDGDVEVTINGGTYAVNPTTVKTLHALNVSGNATVNVYDGTFVGPKGTTADSGSAVTAQAGATVNIYGGTFSGGKNNTLSAKGTLSVYGGTFDQDPTSYVANGYRAVKAGDLYYVISEDASTPVTTADELVSALEAGEDVVLLNSIKIDPANMSNAYGTTGINVKNGQTIDGNGYTLDIKGAGGTWDSGINTTGGTIKNLTVTGSFRGIFINHNSNYSETVVLDNVTIDGTTYTISCDQGMNQNLIATNSTFKGWTSYAATLGSATFNGCTFGEGNGYAYCRPYAPTTFVKCVFEEGYELDATRTDITLVNCYVGETLITAENVAELLGEDAANVKFPTEVNSAEGLTDALTNGGHVVLNGTIDMEGETVAIADGTTIYDGTIENATLTVANDNTASFVGVEFGDTTVVKAQGDGELNFTNCEFNVTPDKNGNSRASAIIGTNQYYTIDLKLDGCTFTYQYTEGDADKYNNAIFMWSNVDSCEIKNCTFNGYGFVAVKLMNVAEGAEIVFEGNTFNMSKQGDANYYSNTAVQIVPQHDNALTVKFINNTFTGDYQDGKTVAEIEVMHGGTLTGLTFEQSGNTINGETVTANNFAIKAE